MALSAAAALPMVALAILAASWQQQREASRFQRDAIRLAQLTSEADAGIVGQVRTLLVSLARRPELQRRPGPRCDSLLASLLVNHPQYVNIGVLELDGYLSCSAQPRRRLNYSDRDYFQRALRDRAFAIGSYLVGRQSGRQSVGFGIPVTDASGRPMRVVYASLSLTAWRGTDTVFARQIPAGATLFKVDEDGRILATAPRADSALLGTELPVFRLIAADSSGSGLIRAPGPGGEPHLYAFAHVEQGLRGRSFVVVLGVPEAVAYADARRTIRTGLAAAGIAALAVVLLGLLVGGALILRPLRAVAGAAERLASGDLKARVGPPYGAGEIGQLQRAFDALAESLQLKEAERDRAIEHLKLSERQSGDLVANARLGIFRLAPDGRFLDANSAMLRTLDCSSAEEIRSLRVDDFERGPLGDGGAMGAFASADAGAGATMRWRTRDGRLVVLRAAARVVKDDAGRVSCFEVFAEDITDRYLLEERFRTLTENSLAGVYTIEDGRLSYVNPAVARIFGYEQDELIGADPLVVVHPDDRGAVRENIRQRVAGEVPSLKYEFRGLRKDGATNRILVLGASVDLGNKRIIVGNILDITEAKRAEEALQRSEHRFSRIFRHSPLPSLLTRMSDEQVLEVNESFLHLTGHSRSEVIGRTTADIRLYLDPSEREQLYGRLRESGRCSNLRARVRTARGDERSLLISATKVDLGGEPCAISFCQDITDLEEARLTALHSEEKFTKVFRSSLTAMSLSDLRDGRLIDVNDQFLKLLGLARDELIGRKIFDVGIFWDAGDRERMVDALRDHTGARDLEMRLRTKDGRAVVVMCSLHVIETEGRLLVVSALLDLSAMREAERALRASEQRFRVAFMTGADAFVIAGREDARIVEVNERFETMFGWPRDEVIGRTALDLGLWADPSARERLLALVRSEGRVRNLEALARRRDGTAFPVQYSLDELPSSHPPLLLGVIRDVTHEHELEDQLRQAQKMEAIGHLTGGIAHDFNNILNVISTNAALARGEVRDARARSDYLADMETAVRQGGSLVRKLLAFSRSERLTPVRIDLARELRDLQRTLQRLLPETIRIQMHVGRRPVHVAVDRVAFEQIVLNLATNARDAMPKGGTLTLEVGEAVCREGHDDHVALGLDAPGRYGIVAVQDTGVGMDRATRQRAFDPFFTTKPPGAGSGLGLAMVFGLMRQHGGSVRLESAPQRGTTVRLYFPVSVGEHSPARKEPEVTRATGGVETILVVEDQELLRRATARALTKLGYTVLVAADGEEGLRVLHEHGSRIALVLSDLVMPRLGGAEFYERLRSEGRHMRFLLMSGHTASPGAGQQPEGVPLIEKPWKVEVLAGRLRELLDAPPPGD